MQIITNNILPQEAINKLKNYGEVVLLETEGIVYDAISKHPDIFFCPVGEEVIIAPNLPEIYKNILSKQKITFLEGNRTLGKKYPLTAFYNAVATEHYLIGNTKIMDKAILEKDENRKVIQVNQAYTRCNLLPLSDERFITSDKGIEKELKKNSLEVLFVNPEGVVLEGFKNGFFGGCCGVSGNRVFIAGSLNNFPEGKKVREFLMDLEIIELYDGPLLDVGSILFIEHR